MAPGARQAKSATCDSTVRTSFAAAEGRGCVEATSSDGAVRRYLAEAVERGEPERDPRR